MSANQLDGQSLDNLQERIEEIKRLLPEAVVEGKFDEDMLRLLLGDDFDNDQEKYRFEWKGKQESLKLAQKRSSATLRPAMGESKNWETTQNLYIEGDNLEVLKLLQRAYLRQVKMIYIDPPYNTGNDFVYKDDFKDPLANYKELTGQSMRANPETAGRYHSNWLNMIYPRLLIAKSLLRDDGVIFISIDDHEVHNLRKVCDEIFGEENFIAQLIWERAYAPKNDAKYVSNSHDYVLMYARIIEQFKIGRLPRTEEANARYRNLDDDPRGPWKSSDLSVKTYSAEYDYPITTPSGRIVEPPSGRCWRFSKKSFEESRKDNRIWFGEDGNSVPAFKRFLSELKLDGMAPTSLMFYKNVGHSQEGTKEVASLLEASLFDGPKPVRLLNRLLTLANTDEGDLILDFFSGSATTAHAVMQLNAEDGGNRRFIMVQIPEKTDEASEAFKVGYKTIADIGKERIRRAGEKIKAELSEREPDLLQSETQIPLDIGFRSFKLDSSNLKQWNSDFSGMTQEQQAVTLLARFEDSLEELVEGRSEFDVVCEVLLKYGLPLTEKISTLQIEDKNFYTVGDEGYLFICLDKNIKIETIERLIETYSTGAIVFAEHCFKDDNEIINIELALQNAGIELRWI
ncbi:site-specific DNA-methyltransferase [Bartonella sp. B17]